MASEKTKKLRKGDTANFKTLKQASKHGDLALVSAIRKSDGAQVALVCAMNQIDGQIVPAPLAVMVEGNPYDLFEDPFA